MTLGYAELCRRTRRHMAAALRGKHEAGVLELRADADEVAMFLFALADGVAIRRLSEPELDIGPVVDLSVAAARGLLS